MEITPKAVNVIVGHYGVGKTNFALNWAYDLASRGVHVTLVDFDVVNPYFRSSDYARDLENAGVNLIAPVLAGSSLDTPSISGAVTTAIESAYCAFEEAEGALKAEVEAEAEEAEGVPSSLASANNANAKTANDVPSQVVIIDAGGDDVGATVLGRFSEDIAKGEYQMLYVVNKYRNLTQDVESALAIKDEIEKASHLFVTGVVNNSHLRTETDEQTITNAFEFGRECANAIGVPLVCTTASQYLLEQKNEGVIQLMSREKIYPVRMIVRTPWE